MINHTVEDELFRQSEAIVDAYANGNKSTARAMFNQVPVSRRGLVAYHITNLFQSYGQAGAYDFFLSVAN